MLHFSKITSKGRDFNLIASGALAFKIQNKILKDESFTQGNKVTRYTLLTRKATGASQKKIFFAIISDLDKTNVEELCHLMAEERAKGAYAVCQIIPSFVSEPSYKALRLLRQNFDEVVELSKFNIGDIKELANAEQQQLIILDYSLSMARIMYHVCISSLAPAQTTTEQRHSTQLYARS